MKIIMTEYLEYNSEFKLGGHQYAELFSKQGHDVLWLSPIYNQLIYFKDKELYEKRKRLNNQPFEQINNIKVYSPYSMILYGNYTFLNSEYVNELSLNTTIPNLYKVLKKNEFGEVDILWITNVKYYPLIEHIKYKKLIYRCPDDIEEFETTCKSMVKLEKKIMKKADVVFVTSNNLMKKKKNISKNIIYLPNGVNLDNFIREQYIIPSEYKNNTRKKCIYVGAIDSWFDSNLIEYCARKLSNVDFYLIGSVKIDLEHLERLENVFILGKRRYEDIPNYLYYSDVGIIPFKVNNLTDSVTPIKLYEYMSVGLNVVSTNFKEMSYINSPAYIASNNEEFYKYIMNTIINKDKNYDINVKFAKNNTWKERFRIINNYL